MVTSRQLKEKVRDYRRSVKHSWLLFKESRIGLLGLGIMTAFVIMALLSPYMGLRDPMNWWAPDEDILRISFSAGVTNEKGNSIDEMLNAADEHLQRAKEAGRNMVIGDE